MIEVIKNGKVLVTLPDDVTINIRVRSTMINIEKKDNGQLGIYGNDGDQDITVSDMCFGGITLKSNSFFVDEAAHDDR